MNGGNKPAGGVEGFTCLKGSVPKLLQGFQKGHQHINNFLLCFQGPAESRERWVHQESGKCMW